MKRHFTRKAILHRHTIQIIRFFSGWIYLEKSVYTDLGLSFLHGCFSLLLLHYSAWGGAQRKADTSNWKWVCDQRTHIHIPPVRHRPTLVLALARIRGRHRPKFFKGPITSILLFPPLQVNELKRSAMRTVIGMSKIPEIEKHPSFIEFMKKIRFYKEIDSLFKQVIVQMRVRAGGRVEDSKPIFLNKTPLLCFQVPAFHGYQAPGNKRWGNGVRSRFWGVYRFFIVYASKVTWWERGRGSLYAGTTCKIWLFQELQASDSDDVMVWEN